MYHLAEPDKYTGADVPCSAKTGRKLWRWEELPIIPETWQLEATASCKEQLKVIKGLLKTANLVVNAGDPDREGQLLIDEVLEEAKYKGEVLRYWANAIDDKSVKNAINTLKLNAEYEGLANSARARGHADWLVGMNLSRAFTLANKSLITVGRVQTPTLRLVYDRDEKIRNFKPIDYFNLTAKFAVEKGEYVGKFRPGENQAGLDEEDRLIDKNVADEIAKAITNQTGVIESVKSENKKINQPLGLSLADLTALASSKLGLSAQEVLNIAQSLYEGKYTSYPRTDCQYLPKSQLADAINVLAVIAEMNSDLVKVCEGADISINSKIWNDEKTTAHHAIVPVASAGKALIGDEAKVYELIARNYISQFYQIHEYMTTEVVTNVQSYSFITKSKTILVNGWKDVYNNEEDETKEDNAIVPVVNQDDESTCIKVDIEATKTKAPTKFTEGTLIKAMENIYKYVENEEYKKKLKDGDGIGTSATRASIIEELKKREYLVKSGKYIQSTTKAEDLLEIVPLETQSPIMTAKYESDLKTIEEGKLSIIDFENSCVKYIKDQVQNAKATTKVFVSKVTDLTCPFCSSKLVEDKYNYSCECGLKCGKIVLGKMLNEKDYTLILGGKSPEFSFISEKTKKTFKAKLVINLESKKLKFEMPAKKDVVISENYKCLKCGQGLIRRESSKIKGKYWWGCSGYPTCKEAYQEDANGKPKLKD